MFSTQSAGLEAWAVVRQPDTGDVSHDTSHFSILFDIGGRGGEGYGLSYAATSTRPASSFCPPLVLWSLTQQPL